MARSQASGLEVLRGCTGSIWSLPRQEFLQGETSAQLSWPSWEESLTCGDLYSPQEKHVVSHLEAGTSLGELPRRPPGLPPLVQLLYLSQVQREPTQASTSRSYKQVSAGHRTILF